jgi:hypothetical protein
MWSEAERLDIRAQAELAGASRDGEGDMVAKASERVRSSERVKGVGRHGPVWTKPVWFRPN